LRSTQSPGTRDIEAVAARVDEILQAYQSLDVAQITAAHHGHRAEGGEFPQDVAHGVGEHGELGPRNDGRKRAVVVQEDRHGVLYQLRSDFVPSAESPG
jgi:hypothetical protein